MEDVIEKAEDAITEVFSDKSVSRKETAVRLRGLVEFIEDMMGTLPDSYSS